MAEFVISSERTAHMHGVAEYMYRHAADDFYDLDPRECYLLGYIHDIGYIDGKSHHEENGGNLLKISGYDNWKQVFHHADLLNMDSIRDKKLILLIEADMKVDMSDKEVGYDRRLESVAERHGRSSRAYKLCRKNVEFLKSIGRS